MSKTFKPAENISRLGQSCMCLVILLCPVWGQTGAPVPGTQSLESRQLTRIDALLTDWAGLTRYGREDTEIRPPKPDERRVIFLGDQITEEWSAPRNGGFFRGKSYLNRGIADQTTGQMLGRFRQDVISIKPTVVVILAGTNDLAGLPRPFHGGHNGG